MPGPLVTVGTTVICAHGGQAEPTTPNPRVTVMGQPTVFQTGPYMVAGCANPPPPANVGPCITGMFTTGTVRVTSMGMPLLVQSSVALCVPTGTPLTIIPTQSQVIAT